MSPSPPAPSPLSSKNKPHRPHSLQTAQPLQIQNNIPDEQINSNNLSRSLDLNQNENNDGNNIYDAMIAV